MRRYWDKVRRGPKCWTWSAAVSSNGYGWFRLVSTEAGRNSHRVAWELTKGPIPGGLHVLHRCDNRRCVRPSHLYLGTNADNVRDKVAKGRQWRKFSSATVRSVREAIRSGLTYRATSAQLGISLGQIHRIVHRAHRAP
jgi:hypothetical protein